MTVSSFCPQRCNPLINASLELSSSPTKREVSYLSRKEEKLTHLEFHKHLALADKLLFRFIISQLESVVSRVFYESSNSRPKKRRGEKDTILLQHSALSFS